MKKLFLLKCMLLLCALVAGSGSAWAAETPIVLFHETFGSTGSIRDWDDSYSVKSGVTAVYSGITGYTVTNARQGKNTTGSTGSGLSQTTQGTDASIIIGPLNVEKYNTLKLTYQWKAGSIKGTYTTEAYYKTSSSAEFTEVSGTGTGATTFVERSYSLPEAAQVSTLYLKIVWNTSNTQAIIDEVELTGVENTRTPIATISGSAMPAKLDFEDMGTFNAGITFAEGTTSDDYEVTWTSSDGNMIAVDNNGDYLVGETRGNVSVTVKVEPVDDATYSEASETFVIKIVDPDLGTASKPYSVAEVLEAIEEGDVSSGSECYVKGIVSRIDSYSDGAIIYFISDDGATTTQFQCNKGKGLNGADFTSISDLELGDLVTVKGNIYTGMGTKMLDTGNVLTELHHRTAVNITSFTADEDKFVIDDEVSTTVANSVPAWTPSYTYESDNEAVAMVDEDGVIYCVAKGTATITVTPNISVSDENYKVGTSLTLDIEVTKPFHHVIFSVNGVASAPESVEEDAAITFADVPSELDGKSFIGWKADTGIDGTTDTAPTTVTSANMGSADITYYAVYANVSSTTVWTRLTAADVNEAGVYAILTTDNHAFNGSISSGHGQVTTDAFSFTNNVASSAPSGTCEITFEAVTGGFKFKNDDNGYLYAKGNTSGNLAWHSSESSYWRKATSNWLYELGSADAYLRSYNNNSFRTYSSTNGDALIFAKKETTVTYSNYCTSLSTVDVTIGDSKYATFCYGRDLDFSASDVKAYTAKVESGKVVLSKVANDVVPANTGVVLYCETADTYTIPVTTTDATVSDNEMVGVTEATAVEWNVGTKYNYILQSGAFNMANGGKLRANRAYLSTAYDVTAASGARSLMMVFDDETTGIGASLMNSEKANGEVYNLNGQRVMNPAKGLYIVNGRKVVVK